MATRPSRPPPLLTEADIAEALQREVVIAASREGVTQTVKLTYAPISMRYSIWLGDKVVIVCRSVRMAVREYNRFAFDC